MELGSEDQGVASHLNSGGGKGKEGPLTHKKGTAAETMWIWDLQVQGRGAQSGG